MKNARFTALAAVLATGLAAFGQTEGETPDLIGSLGFLGPVVAIVGFFLWIRWGGLKWLGL